MGNTSTKVLLGAAALSLLALTGCDQIDPLTRPYHWQASGVNTLNIAAQAANPADLIQGRDTPRRRAAMDADSVDRVWSGKQLPLLGGTGAGGGGAGGASGGSGGTTPAAGGT